MAASVYLEASPSEMEMSAPQEPIWKRTKGTLGGDGDYLSDSERLLSRWSLVVKISVWERVNPLPQNK